MKKISLISFAVVFGLIMVAGNAMAATTIGTNIDTGGTLDVTGATTMTGALDLNNKLDVHDGQDGGVSNGNIIKKTLQAGEDYTGTTAGLMVKNYFEDATANVSSGEFTGLYVNAKDLLGLSGDRTSIISGHVGGSSEDLHAGVWLYGDLINAFKVSNGTSTNGINFSQQEITGSDIVFSNSETISNATNGTVAISDGTDTVSIRPALTGASQSVLTMGTSASKLDFSSMTGSNAGGSIYLTASAADAQVKGLDVSVTDTGSTGTNYLRALNLRLTKTAGVADLDGSESYMWGINNDVTLSGGTILNVWGDVTGVNVTGTSVVGAAGGSPNQVAALYAKSYIAGTATVTDVLDAPIIASVIDGTAARKKADAAVIAVLRGGNSVANTAGAAFKVMDMVSEADQSGSNFDYGLDLYFVDNGAGRGYANVFETADIRLSNSEVISNTTDGTISFGAANLTTTGMVIKSIDAAAAAAGSTQADGVALTKDINNVTGADDSKGAVLPTAVAGMDITIINQTGSTLKLYGFADAQQINGVGGNTAYSIATLVTARCMAISSTNWECQKTSR